MVLKKSQIIFVRLNNFLKCFKRLYIRRLTNSKTSKKIVFEKKKKIQISIHFL